MDMEMFNDKVMDRIIQVSNHARQFRQRIIDAIRDHENARELIVTLSQLECIIFQLGCLRGLVCNERCKQRIYEYFNIEEGGDDGDRSNSYSLGGTC